MNRNDLRKYFKSLKTGEQRAFVEPSQNQNKLLKESFGDANDPYNLDSDPDLVMSDMRSSPSSFEYQPLPNADDPLERLAANIHSLIDNAVGQYSEHHDTPLTKEMLLYFVIQNLVEEKELL